MYNYVTETLDSGTLIISVKVLALEDRRGLICKSLSLSSDFKVLENFRGLRAFSRATVCKTVRPVLSDRCLSVLPCPVLSLTLV